MIKRALILCLSFALLGGCLERLNDVGRAPEMTPVSDAVASNVSPERAAMARAPATSQRQFYAQGSLWASGPTSLFGDRRAATTGDILTIIIDINDRAQLSNTTGRARSGSESMSIAALMGLPESINGDLPEGASLDPAADFGSTSVSSGTGTVNRNEKITLRIAATVVDVLANGHLVVQGLQEVRVNFELRELAIAGIIRAEDISRNNEITYDKMAGARISYGGRGQITDLQQPRYGQQIFDVVAPF
jgi:flagellar L-ring protein precursor FlgH